MKLKIIFGAYLLFSWLEGEAKSRPAYVTKPIVFSKFPIYTFDQGDIYKLFKRKLFYVDYQNKYVTINYPLKKL